MIFDCSFRSDQDFFSWKFSYWKKMVDTNLTFLRYGPVVMTSSLRKNPYGLDSRPAAALKVTLGTDVDLSNQLSPSYSG